MQPIEPMSTPAKQDALRLLQAGMNLCGEWRHAEAVALFDQGLALTPTGLFARLLWELKGHALQTLGRSEEAEAAYAQASATRVTPPSPAPPPPSPPS